MTGMFGQALGGSHLRKKVIKRRVKSWQVNESDEGKGHWVMARVAAVKNSMLQLYK